MIKLCSVCFFAVSLYAADPFAGTWKMNVAKSTASPNRPKEVTAVSRDLGSEADVTVKGIDAKGAPISQHYTVPAKGGPVKYIEGGPPAGVTSTARVIDERTREMTQSRDGKTLSTSRLTLSADGKTITQTVKGVTPDGTGVNVVGIFERQ